MSLTVRLFRCLATLSLAMAALPLRAHEPQRLEIGAAQVDITPPVGYRLAGGYEEAVSQRVFDPLFAKVLVCSQGESRAAIVICDLCSIGREVSQPIREELSRRTGVPIEHVVVLATHTHGGPEYYGTLRDLLHELAIDQQGADPRETVDYPARLQQAIGAAGEEAWRRRRPLDLAVGAVPVPGLAFNRRFHMRDGRVQFNPGKGRSDIVRPAGPVDDELPVLLFREPETQQPQIAVTTFAMHTAAFGDGRSFGADFPGVLQAELQQLWGPEFLSLFLEGAAGDVNHIDVDSPAPQDPLTERLRIGRRLAEAVQTAAASLAPVSAPRLHVASARAPIPLIPVTPEEVADARRRLRDHLSRSAPLEFLDAVACWRTLNTDLLRRRDGERLLDEIQVLAFARDVALVTLPHEVFVELGLAIKARSPFRRTVVCSLANDIDFYVPTRRAFTEGSYEVTTSSFQPGGGELLVDAAVQLLEQVHTNYSAPE